LDNDSSGEITLDEMIEFVINNIEKIEIESEDLKLDEEFIDNELQEDNLDPKSPTLLKSILSKESKKTLNLSGFNPNQTDLIERKLSLNDLNELNENLSFDIEENPEQDFNNSSNEDSKNMTKNDETKYD